MAKNARPVPNPAKVIGKRLISMKCSAIDLQELETMPDTFLVFELQFLVFPSKLLQKFSVPPITMSDIKKSDNLLFLYYNVIHKQSGGCHAS